MPWGKFATTASWILNCAPCQPSPGCVLSDLKGKKKQEIISSLDVLTDEGLNRIISIHNGCPDSEKLAI